MSSFKQFDGPQYVDDNVLSLARSLRHALRPVDSYDEECNNDASEHDVEANTGNSQCDSESSSRPGAFRVAGIDAPLNVSDDDDCISHSESNNSPSMEDSGAPFPSVPSITATLVEPDDDRTVLLDEIRQLRAERDNVAQAEAVVLPTEDQATERQNGIDESKLVVQRRCFPTRRRTLLCLLLGMCATGLIFGIVIGLVSLNASR
jgi:hypothetical protein